MKHLLPLRLQTAVRNAANNFRGVSQWVAVTYEPKVLPDAIPFLNPIDGICEEAPPRLMWSAHYLIIAMFFTMLAAAWLTRVDVVVVGSGSLTTEKPPMVVQTIERGIIRELNVRPGDSVHKGQVLAVLDPTFAHADMAAISSQQQSLQAQSRRLEAELSDKPWELGISPTLDEKTQYSLYEQRKNYYKSRLREFDEDIQRLASNVKTADVDKTSLAKQLGYAQELEQMRAQLLQSQNGSKLNYLDAQSLRVRTEREYQDAENRAVEQQHALQAKQAERQSFIDDWRRQILESQTSIGAELDKVTQSLAKASLINDLVVITAPGDGMVLDVAKRSVGSIVRETEPLVTIVPSDEPLSVDITINSSDVGHIHAGDDVVLKVDAFPYQLHGGLQGRLMYVSEESYLLTEAGGEAQGPAALRSGNANGTGAVHRGRVEITGGQLHNLPEGAHLIPGMTVSAEIKVGSRNVLAFFLNPLTRGLSESLREP